MGGRRSPKSGLIIKLWFTHNCVSPLRCGVQRGEVPSSHTFDAVNMLGAVLTHFGVLKQAL